MSESISENTPDAGRLCLGALEFSPEVAKHLGIYVAEFATLEVSLIRLFAFVLGHANKLDVAGTIFGRIRNVTDRCDILKACTSISSLPPDDITFILSCVEDALAINSRRNQLIHGVYHTQEQTGDVTLYTWALSATRKGETQKLSWNKIENDTFAIKALNGRIIYRYFLADVPTFEPSSPHIPT